MKFLTWLFTFIIAYAVNNFLNNLGIAYYLSLLIAPEGGDRAALIAGTFAAIHTVVLYGLSFYFSDKINKNRELTKFQKAAAKSGLTTFEYAKSITPYKVITYCDSHLDEPVYKITAKLDQLPDSKVISRPCADALIEGYTKLMQQQTHSDIFDDPNVIVNWREQ